MFAVRIISMASPNSSEFRPNSERMCNESPFEGGDRAPLRDYLFFFSFFSFRFSIRLRAAFFWCSRLPLSFFPVSPMSVSPCLKMTCTF